MQETKLTKKPEASNAPGLENKFDKLPFWLKFSSFFNTRRFAAELTQVIKLRPAHFAHAFHLYFIYRGAMQRENTLHAHAARNFPHREGLVQSAVLPSDDYALEHLDAFPYAFLDLNVYP